MLLPKELDKLPDRVAELYAELENDIIRDMARRIVKTDFATDTAQWQLIQLERLSVTHDKVFDRLSKATGKSKKELVKMFNEAADTAFAREDKAYRKAGYKTVPLAENAQLQKIINAGLRKTNNLFENLTGTTANTASRQFENALDRAYMQITSGAFDYNTAIRTCIRDLAQKGIAYITYPSGHTDYLDVAVRRAALTGVGQTCGEMQLELAAEMDCDLVEVTAHNGARPEHAEWQGKVFSLSGKSRKYPDFVKSTGYGTGAGLKGWNCRHDFFPFFEDSEPAYTQKELAEFENRKVTYNGEEMSEYDATQKQREMERRIRSTKRELAGYDAGINTTDNDSLKADLQAAFDRKSVLLKKQEAALKDFTKQTGLIRDRSREQSYGFNKSVSQKSVMSNKKSIDNSARNSIMKRRKSSKRDIQPISEKTFSDLTIEARKNGATILRGTPDVEHHLDIMKANASSIGDILFFRKDVTISEVLEETYHFKQFQLKMFEEYPHEIQTCLREIDAKEYLLKNAKKYHIPRTEIEETERQLKSYRSMLKYLRRSENIE